MAVRTTVPILIQHLQFASIHHVFQSLQPWDWCQRSRPNRDVILSFEYIVQRDHVRGDLVIGDLVHGDVHVSQTFQNAKEGCHKKRRWPVRRQCLAIEYDTYSQCLTVGGYYFTNQFALPCKSNSTAGALQMKAKLQG